MDDGLVHLAIPTGLFMRGGQRFESPVAMQAMQNLEAININLQQLQKVSPFGFTPLQARTWQAKPAKITCKRCVEYSQTISANVLALAQGLGADVAAQLAPPPVGVQKGFIQVSLNERALLQNLEVLNANLLLLAPSFCTAGTTLRPCSDEKRGFKTFGWVKFSPWIMEVLEIINGNLLTMVQCNAMNSGLAIRIEPREPAVFPSCCVIV